MMRGAGKNESKVIRLQFTCFQIKLIAFQFRVYFNIFKERTWVKFSQNDELKNINAY